MNTLRPEDLASPVVLTGCTVCGRDAVRGETLVHAPACPVGQVTELRAVLAPQLALGGHARYREGYCQFCGEAISVASHKSDCPILRADALLGR